MNMPDGNSGWVTERHDSPDYSLHCPTFNRKRTYHVHMGKWLWIGVYMIGWGLALGLYALALGTT